MYTCIWVRLGLTKPYAKPSYITPGRVFSVLVKTYLNFSRVWVLIKDSLDLLSGESVYDETKGSVAMFKAVWNFLINQYRMMRPIGGCNPEFGVNHVYLCVPLFYDLCVQCMCVIICLNDLCVSLMWGCAGKPCMLSFKIVLWFTITLDYWDRIHPLCHMLLKYSRLVYCDDFILIFSFS